MRNRKPPFEITNTMIHEIAEIAELVGKLTSTNQLSANPTLRRTNRIRTIHASLAIEQNTLSLEQVTAVLNGKQVLAPPKDIAEVTVRRHDTLGDPEINEVGQDHGDTRQNPPTSLDQYGFCSGKGVVQHLGQKQRTEIEHRLASFDFCI